MEASGDLALWRTSVHAESREELNYNRAFKIQLRAHSCSLPDPLSQGSSSNFTVLLTYGRAGLETSRRAPRALVLQDRLCPEGGDKPLSGPVTRKEVAVVGLAPH